MKKSDELLLTTQQGFSAEGAAIGRSPDGRVVFVRGAAPEETVRVRLTHVAKRFLRAELLAVVEPSDVRVDAPCEHSKVCGGCPLMHIDPQVARREKVAGGREALRRIGGLPDEVPVEEPDELFPVAGFRARARFAVEADRVGYRRAATQEVVPVRRCLALHPRLEEARAFLADKIRARGWDGQGTEELSMITDGTGVSVQFPDRLRDLASMWREAFATEEEAILTVEDEAGPLFLQPSVFAQASLSGNAALLRGVARALPEHGAVALELYAGSGNFTRLLSARFDEVVAVEVGSSAVALGRRLDLPNVRWVAAPASVRHLEGIVPDWVVVNPPRTGLDPNVRRELVRLQPSHMLYVSCNAGTLARDLRELHESGLWAQTVAAFDVYPATPHVEWVVSLSRQV